MRKLLIAILFLLLGSLASASQPERDTPDLDAFDPHTVAFVQLMFGHQPEEEHQPGRDPRLPEPKVQEPLEMPEMVAVPLKFEPSFVAGDLCGLIVLVSGLAGWIALGVAVLIVERNQTKPV
jgi:hypothetical protein